MSKINIIRPPKVSVDAKKAFWKQIVMIIIGSTISLALTVSVAAVMERNQRAKDRKLSAMMVLSNIESFARTLEIRSDKMAVNDSVAAWLLNTPFERLELLPDEELGKLFSRATNLSTLNHDHSAENVFSNNIETWKNLGNVHFIDNVGSCFSAIGGVEDQFNDWVTRFDAAKTEVNNNPSAYEGNTLTMKKLHSDKIRTALNAIHNRRCWLRYAAASLRYYNLQNMRYIGISEEEVMAYTDKREDVGGPDGTPPDAEDFYTSAFTLDSLPTMAPLTAKVDSLAAL